MSDLHQFNPGRKSWKMYTKELTSISGDNLTITPYEGEDLILEVSGNGNILFKEDGIIYNLADLSNNASSSSSSNVNLTNYDNDASLNNLDISGNLNVINGLVINNIGAIGIGGANYGNQYEVLMSNGSGSAVSWTNTLTNITSNGNFNIQGSLQLGGSVGTQSGQILQTNLGLTHPVWTSTLTNMTTSGTFNINSNLQLQGLNGNSGQILQSNGGAAPSWVDAPRPKEAFNMRFNNKLNAYPAGSHGISAYNLSSIMSGTNANTANGRYTANREIWMNFMFVGLQYNNTGGTNDMSQSIRRYNSSNQLQEEVAGQTIPSHLDAQNVIQATLSMNVVMKCNPNDYVIAVLASSQPFLAYSIGINSNVVFSGHNVD